MHSLEDAEKTSNEGSAPSGAAAKRNGSSGGSGSGQDGSGSGPDGQAGTHIAMPSQPHSGPEGTGTGANNGSGGNGTGSGGGSGSGNPAVAGADPRAASPDEQQQHHEQEQEVEDQDGHHHHYHHHHHHHHRSIGRNKLTGQTEASIAHMEAEATHTLPQSQQPHHQGDFAAPPPRPKLPVAGNNTRNGHGGWSSSVPPPVVNGKRHINGAAHHYRNAHGSGATSKAVGSFSPLQDGPNAAAVAAAAAPINGVKVAAGAPVVGPVPNLNAAAAKLGAQEVAEVAEALASLRGACEAAIPRGGAAFNPPRAPRAPRNAAATGLLPVRSGDTQIAVVRGSGDSAGDPPSGPATMISPEAVQLQASAAAAAAAAARSGLPPMFAHQIPTHALPPGVDPAMLQQQYAAHYHPQYAPYGFLPAPIPYWAAPPGMLQAAAPGTESGGATPAMSMQYAYAPPPPPLPPPSTRGGQDAAAQQALEAQQQQQQQYSAAMPWLQQSYLMHVAAAMQQQQQQQQQQPQSQQFAAASADVAGVAKVKTESGVALATYPRPLMGLHGSVSGLGASPMGRVTPGSVIGAGISSAGPSMLDTNGGGPHSSAPPQSRTDVRQAALAKYREKRKARDSNAASKIRYQSRKVLAEARPRVRGQFVRVNKDANTATGTAGGGGGEIEASSDALGKGIPTTTTTNNPKAVVANPKTTTLPSAPDKGSGDDNGNGGVKDVGSRPESAPDSREAKVSDREDEEEDQALNNEAMEYDCQEEDLGDEEEDVEPSGGAPAEAEIGVGVAEMVVAEPTPTTNGPTTTTNTGTHTGVTGRRMTRSQLGPKTAPAPHLTGHKHGRQQSANPAVRAGGGRGSTPAVDEDPGSNQTKTNNNNNNGGSDSGSNSPQEEVGPPGASLKTLAGKPPPAKQQHI